MFPQKSSFPIGPRRRRFVLPRLAGQRWRAGFTLMETMVGAAIVAIFFAGLYATLFRSMQYLKAANVASNGTRALTTMAEQIRNSTWTQITDSTQIQGVISTCVPGPALGYVTETIDVTPSPIGSPVVSNYTASTMEVQRGTNGTISITKPGDGSLPSQTMVRVDLTVQWKSAFNGALNQRMMSLLVSQNGIQGQH